MSKSNFQYKNIDEVIKKLRATINKSLSLIGQKQCVKCDCAKPFSDFTKSVQQKDGLFPYCKECVRKDQEQRRRRNGIKPLKRRTIYELPEKKICTLCNRELEKGAFRVRWQDKKYPILNPTCKECDKALAKTRYKIDRATVDGKAKHNQWAKNRYYRNRDRLVNEMREKRKSPEYKAYMKAYREKNKEKIREQEIITKRRYHEKHRDSISDSYCFRQLKTQGTPIEIITPELIELERQKILLSRIKLKIKNYGKQNQKPE